MANYERYEKTTTEVVYALRTPTNGAELNKLLQAAAKERADALHTSTSSMPDDAMTVSVLDDSLLISWEVR